MARAKKKAGSKLELAYENLKEEVRNGHASDALTEVISTLYESSLEHLGDFKPIDLVSRVPGKEYVAYAKGKRISRAINAKLYRPDFKEWKALRAVLAAGPRLEGKITPQKMTRVLYSMAISFCAAIDLLKSGDQKTPGTFFEHFIASFFTWRLGVQPKKAIQVLNLDEENTELPTDFVFNLGKNRQKFHMPVKTSSRERAVMLWAHQRLLDGVFGIERFMGTAVLLAETKTDGRSREVVEICSPAQWRLYQLYIAQLKRIYYLDIPEAYEQLGRNFPPLVVKPFGEFFFEWKSLTPA